MLRKRSTPDLLISVCASCRCRHNPIHSRRLHSPAEAPQTAAGAQLQWDVRTHHKAQHGRFAHVSVAVSLQPRQGSHRPAHTHTIVPTHADLARAPHRHHLLFLLTCMMLRHHRSLLQCAGSPHPLSHPVHCIMWIQLYCMNARELCAGAPAA